MCKFCRVSMPPKLLESAGSFFSKISRTVRKVLKNEFGPGKSWKLV